MRAQHARHTVECTARHLLNGQPAHSVQVLASCKAGLFPFGQRRRPGSLASGEGRTRLTAQLEKKTICLVDVTMRDSFVLSGVHGGV